MVVAACTQEQRARIAPGRPVETEPFGVEGGPARVRSPTCRWTCPMTVPAGIPAQRDSPAAASRPPTSTGSVAICSSRPTTAPRVAWAVGVDLDAETVRVPQVERLAHQVVGGACGDVLVSEMTHAARECARSAGGLRSDTARAVRAGRPTGSLAPRRDARGCRSSPCTANAAWPGPRSRTRNPSTSWGTQVNASDRPPEGATAPTVVDSGNRTLAVARRKCLASPVAPRCRSSWPHEVFRRRSADQPTAAPARGCS